MSTVALVLHSSPWRLTLQWLTPTFLLALAAYSLIAGASGIPVVVLGLFGFGAAGVVLFDLPIRSEFTEQGVTRICPLRRQHLPWSRVVAVERLGGPVRRHKDEDEDATSPRGLAARTGPRRLHLLVDRGESRAEFAALRDLLAEHATQLRARQPPMDASPAGRGPFALHRRESP